ncbi:MAG TPA: TlyA family RNA methyltransferase [Candidatus Sulfomarinibacteraceae bacterium]|nr:TlyA family RNA methyltransferase [Candidatus Sulfomarinibacteraceae bacterium]
MAKEKERLDKLLVARGLAHTRSRAQALIMAGEVTVDGRRVDKAGAQIALDAVIEVAQPLPYVSRGGYKLAGALDAFEIGVANRRCADVGACTGGFTDVLLQRGARLVYAIDVGYGQLAWKLRQDERVVVMERTNARHLESLPQTVDFVAIDVSFISLRLILPQVKRWLATDGDVVALVKPQFEAGPDQVGKGGIVRDSDVHRQVLEVIVGWAEAESLGPAGLIRSPIEGSAGNVEFLLWLRPGREADERMPEMIDAVLQ